MRQSHHPTRFRPFGKQEDQEHQELMASLIRTRTLINQAYGSFNCACDSELIESYVFEINALQARYNYLLRRAKELNPST